MIRQVIVVRRDLRLSQGNGTIYLTKPKSWSKKEIDLLIKNYPTNPDVYKLFPDRTKCSINHKTHKLGIKRIKGKNNEI